MECRLTHVLVECPELIASVRVGVLEALKPLSERGLLEMRFRETRNVHKCDLSWCDIFVCVRGSELMTYHIVQEAKRLNRLVIYFLDDDLLNLPKESLSYDYFTYGEIQRHLRACLLNSDILWGANSQIRDKYLPLSGGKKWIWSRLPIRIAPNAGAVKQKDYVEVLYAGSIDHRNIVREILLPAVQEVISRLGAGVRFTFVGPSLGIPSTEQIRHRAFFTEYDEYRAFVETGGFQIGLAPTKLEDFFQCKYYNKFVEYTSVGATGIYTDCPLYRQVVEDGYNGILCSNSPSSWADAICKLVENKNLRQTCHSNARALLEAQFSPEQVGSLLLEQLPELSTYRAPLVDVAQVRLKSPWLYFYMGRVNYLWGKHGLLSIPIMAYKAMKKIYRVLRKGITSVFKAVCKGNI